MTTEAVAAILTERMIWNMSTILYRLFYGEARKYRYTENASYVLKFDI